MKEKLINMTAKPIHLNGKSFDSVMALFLNHPRAAEKN